MRSARYTRTVLIGVLALSLGAPCAAVAAGGFAEGFSDGMARNRQLRILQDQNRREQEVHDLQMQQLRLEAQQREIERQRSQIEMERALLELERTRMRQQGERR